MNPGKCGLCGNVEALQNSHLLPKSIYKILRQIDPLATNKKLLSNIGEHFSTSDKQITKFFLCKNCESLFDSQGEKKVIPYCYHGVHFPLKDYLEAQPFDNSPELNMVVYDTSSFTETNSFMYFALSIFWRASITNWPPYTSYRNALGNKLEADLGLYLQNKASLGSLNNIAIIVQPDLDNPPYPFFMFPQHTKKGCVHFHSFCIPGIRFLLLVLKDIRNFLPFNIIFMGQHFSDTQLYDKMQKKLQLFTSKKNH